MSSRVKRICDFLGVDVQVIVVCEPDISALTSIDHFNLEELEAKLR